MIKLSEDSPLKRGVCIGWGVRVPPFLHTQREGASMETKHDNLYAVKLHWTTRTKWHHKLISQHRYWADYCCITDVPSNLCIPLIISMEAHHLENCRGRLWEINHHCHKYAPYRERQQNGHSNAARIKLQNKQNTKIKILSQTHFPFV